MTRIVLVPGCLALLPEYASLTDPVLMLRQACEAAVSWLGASPVVLADPQGERVARHLLAARSVVADTDERCHLVVANGSACRTDRAPGSFDPRAEGFDADLGRALAGPDPVALAGVDQVLAHELWASVAPIHQLATLLAAEPMVADVDYDDAPFGVQYWVARWH